MYRKVIYQYWIPAIKEKINTDPGWKSVNGTGCFSHHQSGYFHTWGTESRELAEDVLIDTVAIIEDVTTGQIHKVDPSKMRFVQPPELRKHKSEVWTESDFNENVQACRDKIEQVIKNFDNLKNKAEVIGEAIFEPEDMEKVINNPQLFISAKGYLALIADLLKSIDSKLKSI